MAKIIQSLKQLIKSGLPRGLRISKPVVQAYFEENDISSRYHLTNIPSFYSPENAYPVDYECSMFSESGKLVEKKSLSLDPYCSFEVNPPVFFKNKMPQTGLFMARMRPRNFFQYSDRHLGLVTAHFYSFYQDKKTGSMALIHPQTHLQAKVENKQWKSRVMIDRSKIKKVLILQINPTENLFENVIIFNSTNDEVLHQISFQIKPMGCNKQEIDIQSFKTISPYIYIGANRLSTDNAKPIIFLYDETDQFFGLHA